MDCSLITRSLLSIGLLACFAPANYADEVIIDGKAKSNVTVGDFDCSKCPSRSPNNFSLSDRSPTEMTAGELWQFFDAQGLSSVERLILCLDVTPGQQTGKFGINSMELKIEDPSQLGSHLTDVSLGDNSLVFHDYDITAFKPEAKLQVKLGYNFMERFSADSTEKILLDVSSDGEGYASSQPSVSVQAESGFFSSKFNMITLGAFAVFWTLVFLMLNRFTKRQVINHEPTQRRPVSSSKQQALSA